MVDIESINFFFTIHDILIHKKMAYTLPSFAISYAYNFPLTYFKHEKVNFFSRIWSSYKEKDTIYIKFNK